MTSEQAESSFMKIKNAGIFTVVISQLIVLSGAFMKVQHNPYGSYTLAAGVCLSAISLVLLLLPLLKKKPFAGN